MYKITVYVPGLNYGKLKLLMHISANEELQSTKFIFIMYAFFII